MSQLAVKLGRNAGRQAKKLREIRKVKAAIQWHERERKKRQETMQQRWDAKQAILARNRWTDENIRDVKRRALREAKEDWQQGPLRPNRAIGENAGKYGALTISQAQHVDIPVEVQKSRNEFKEKQGLRPEYPLVVDDQKYFPIVKGDRVMLLKGRNKGRLGVIDSILRGSHRVSIKNINKHYYDSDLFGASAASLDSKHPSEVPIPIADVRLVIPFEVTEQGHSFFTDVIVDNIDMEQHTTGIDPYTGTDYGQEEFPKEHRLDPKTSLPIFHRYVAGTGHRIEWPWERVEAKSNRPRPVKEHQSWFKKTINTARHPITSINRWMKNDDAPAAAPVNPALELAEMEEKHIQGLKARPRSNNPRLSDVHDLTDTARHIVEGVPSMAYSLLTPPMPNSLSEELRDEIREFTTKTNKESDSPDSKIKKTWVGDRSVKVREASRVKQIAAQKMKTPMQVRWELEQAKKLYQQQKNPMVDSESLMAALGQHMQKNRVKVPKRIADTTAELVD